MKKVFIELQRATGFSNFECGRYLGISEGAVKDRRDGRCSPRQGELIALAVYGSESQERALEYIKTLNATAKK
ncbi:hypothetical protein [Vibrio jasicida]|uniref:hypothetical protein n=1 Tax=Vibrio jasicida TaxID=766224 RepID=UPI000CE55324|nr:hypothetical protein [Vibrio jasicida]